jgi:hypothetical protein
MDNIKKNKRTLIINEDIRLNSLKIAKKKGINTFTTLVNILLAEYVEKNQELLERKS